MFKASLVVMILIIVVQKKSYGDQRGFLIRERPAPSRGPILNLFQWSYADITEECKTYLGSKGFSAVQVSPVTENINIPGHPWTEKYEPISYKLNSRAGSEAEFVEMTRECSTHEVKIYVEVVLNHMTKTYPAGTVGYANSSADTANFDYPAIPYTKEDFHYPSCTITDDKNITQILNCELDGRHDLDQSREHVRSKIVEFLNYLTSLGAAGFCINSAGYMKLKDLVLIYKQLNFLNTDIHFSFFQKPFFYHEVIDKGAISVKEHAEWSKNIYATDFHYGLKLKEYFTGQKSKVLEPLKISGQELKLKDLQTFKSTVRQDNAIVFIDNHLTQRGLAYEDEEYLTLSKNPKEYRLAIAFMLAYVYGEAVIMSGYNFNDPNQGPPSSDDGNLMSVGTEFPHPCSNGWTCEHRDRVIAELVRFSYLARYAPMVNWWDNGGNQIAFERNWRGFLVINLDNTDINKFFQTSLPLGHYCDVFTGTYTDEGICTGKEIFVNSSGIAEVTLKAGDPNGAIFIYSDSKIPFELRMEYIKKQWQSGH